MDREIKRKWVEALLSGQYKQTTSGVLRDYYGHCCLGVLRELYGGITSPDSPWLTKADLRRFGLSMRAQKGLGDLNDDDVPFDMIAGLIDSAL